MKTLKMAQAIVLTMAATSAHALWDPYMMELNYVVNLNSDGRSVSFPAENYHANGPVRRVSEKIQAIPTRLLDGLDEAGAKAFSELSNGEVRLSNYRGHIALMTVSARLQARPDGGADVSVGIPEYVASGNAGGSKYGIGFNCNLSVKLSDPRLQTTIGAGLTNPSGVVTLTSNASHSASCSTSIDWIPILGPIANNFVNKMASGLLATHTTKLNHVMFDVENLADLQGASFGEDLLQLVGPNSELGQYIYNNRGRIASSTSVDLVLSRGIIVGPESFPPSPSLVSFDGRFFQLKLNVPGRQFAVEVYERGTLRTPPVHCYKNSKGQLICIEV